MNKEYINKAFEEKSARGVVKSQDLNSYEIIEGIMHKGLDKGAVWWFAYELMGFHEIKGKTYFMSYKASTRVSEMAKEGLIESRQTEGKLHLYRLITK